MTDGEGSLQREDVERLATEKDLFRLSTWIKSRQEIMEKHNVCAAHMETSSMHEAKMTTWEPAKEKNPWLGLRY